MSGVAVVCIACSAVGASRPVEWAGFGQEIHIDGTVTPIAMVCQAHREVIGQIIRLLGTDATTWAFAPIAAVDVQPMPATADAMLDLRSQQRREQQ